MLRAGGIRRDERQVHFGLGRGGEFDLGLFGGFLQALQGKLVGAQVDTLFFFELVGQVIDNALIEIFPAEERVAIGGFHFEHAVADFQHGHVEGAAAEIVHGDGARTLLLKPIGQRSGGGLVDDAQHFEAGDLACVAGGLALGVVEIGRNGDDGLGDGLAQESFRRFLHLLQNEGADLRRGIFLGAAFHPRIAIVAADDLISDEADFFLHQLIVEAPTDQALYGEKGIFRVRHRLALRGLADEAVAIFGEGHHRWRRARAFGVFDNPGVLAIHDGNAGIGSAQVNPDNFAHQTLPSV